MKLCDSSYMHGMKIKIHPTEEQKQEINKNFETARAVYNLALEIQIKNYNSGNLFIPYFDMIKLFTELRSKEEYKWMNQISVGTINSALRNLDNAYNLFFKKLVIFQNLNLKISSSVSIYEI